MPSIYSKKNQDQVPTIVMKSWCDKTQENILNYSKPSLLLLLLLLLLKLQPWVCLTTTTYYYIQLYYRILSLWVCLISESIWSNKSVLLLILHPATHKVAFQV